LPLRSDPSRKVKYGRNFSICDSPALYRVSDFKGLEAEAVVLIMRGRVGNHREATYVGLSRARVLLCIVADATAAAVLPKSFSWDQG